MPILISVIFLYPAAVKHAPVLLVPSRRHRGVQQALHFALPPTDALKVRVRHKDSSTLMGQLAGNCEHWAVCDVRPSGKRKKIESHIWELRASVCQNRRDEVRHVNPFVPMQLALIHIQSLVDNHPFGVLAHLLDLAHLRPRAIENAGPGPGQIKGGIKRSERHGRRFWQSDEQSHMQRKGRQKHWHQSRDERVKLPRDVRATETTHAPKLDN
mmetsp:Transcript_46109/g.128207  ORF Transcript_46109/g.128207 Transcript_46109/m.128207 type:complete len:213 (+) Transcript_46109:737-1375(+)